MGSILLAGGVVGSSLGVLLFSILRDIGQIDLVIKLSYVIFLGIIGALMLMESVRRLCADSRAQNGANCTSITDFTACH